jgi:hypothetical protein
VTALAASVEEPLLRFRGGAAVAHGGMPRTECVWLDPNCEEAQRRLF